MLLGLADRQEKIGGSDDEDTLILPQGQQVPFIPRDDVRSPPTHGALQHLVIVWVDRNACDRARNGNDA